MARLVLFEGSATDASHELGEHTTLGRDPACTIFISDQTVAPHQAEIRRLPDGHYQLRDTAGRMRVLVNRRPVSEVLLSDGDEIVVGSVRYFFAAAVASLGTDDATAFDDISVEIQVRGDATAEMRFDDLSDEAGASELQAELRRLKAAYRLSRAVGVEQDVEVVLENILGAVFDVFEPDRAGVFLLDPGTGQIASRRMRTRDGASGELQLVRSAIRKALEGREAIVSSNVARDGRFGAEVGAPPAEGLSIMCVPLIEREATLGFIYLDCQARSGVFDAKDLQLLTTFARQAALAARNTSLIAELRLANEAVERVNDELRHSNDELQKLVVRDPLTLLYNHAFLQDMLEQEIGRCDRHGLECGLLLVDIDGFRKINDSLGHAVGNEVLRLVADVCAMGRRRSDVCTHFTEEPIVSRFEQDTFAILLPHTPKGGALTVAERLREQAGACASGREGVPPITLSVGVAAYPTDAPTRPALVEAAEAALRAAKKTGGNQVVSYTPSLAMRQPQDQDSELQRIVALDRVIQNVDMDYVYQPIVQTDRNAIFAYEALCRPRVKTLANPLELLATAERNGRIAELGLVMRELAIAALPRLPEPLLLFVNLHPLELNEALLPWAEKLAAPQRLVLEVTECAQIVHYRRVRDLLRELKQLGLRIALDDLGAGYSGLNSLVELEPDFVKLDMRMVQDIHSDSRQARLIKHLLEFAAGEGMTVIAEGIETAAERDAVTGLGCTHLQGYFYARPQPPFCPISTSG